MSSPATDYAALAEKARQSTPSVDYNALAEQARQQPAATPQPQESSQLGDLFGHAWDQFTGAIQGAVQTVRHPIDTLSAEKQRTTGLLGKAADAWKAGDKGAALDFASEAVPVLGALNKQTQQEFLAGKYGAGFGDLLGFFGAAKLGGKAAEGVGKVVAAAPEMLPKAAAATTAAVKAGGKDVAVGGAKTAAGVALAKAGPLGEIGDVMAGVPIIKTGLQQVAKGAQAGYKAGKDALSARVAAAVQKATEESKPTAASPEASAGQGATPESITPDVSEPVDISTTDAAARAKRATNIKNQVNWQPGEIAPAPARDPAKVLQFGKRGAAAESATAPESATPTGKTPTAEATAEPAVKQIPFKAPDVAPEVFADKARGEKVDALAQLLHKGGIPASDAARMTAADWKLAAQGAGVKPPSAQSVILTLSKLKKLETSSRISTNVVDKLRKAGALDAAQKIADAMGEPDAARAAGQP